MIDTQPVVYGRSAVHADRNMNSAVAKYVCPFLVQKRAVRLYAQPGQPAIQVFTSFRRRPANPVAANQRRFASMKRYPHAVRRSPVAIFAHSEQKLLEYFVAHKFRAPEITQISVLIQI